MNKRQFLDELKLIGESKETFYEKTGKTSSLSGYKLDENLPISYDKLLLLLKDLHKKDKIIEALNTIISQQ